MSAVHPRRRTPPVTPSDNGLGLKTIGLRKGATFHSPTSPVQSSCDTFIPPALGRAQTNLEDVVDAHRRRMALIVDDLDKSFNLNLNLDDNDNASQKKNIFRDESYPVPRGFLEPPTVDPAAMKTKPGMERRSSRLRERRSSRNQLSDSGLGTSLGSTHEKQSAVTSAKGTKASAITRSAAATSSTKTERRAGFSSKARSRIQEHILRPLLAKPSLKDFEPIVLDVPRRIHEKEIVCLRDLEKTLIFMAPERTKSAALYLDFCLTSIRCIQATVEHNYLSEREQIRPNDRPYTNGYFIDLVDQIRQYAGQLASAKDLGPDADAMDVDHTDEVKLFGGIHENGRPAELVRIRKDGKAISMATGLPVDLDEDTKDHVRLKRSLSQQLDDEEEIMRSMARRKKNATPEELAPKKCREPGCNKEFKRPCDLTKHEKTHSRPWKCPIKNCKYHEYGWPTEKEMDRHVNDKHSNAPAMYECLFKPCPYKSKRESNCKQHMEKAHGWVYVRTKTNGKKPSSKAASSTHPTPQLGNMPTPSSNHSIATPPEEHQATFATINQNVFNPNGLDFPIYQSDEDFDRFISTMNPQPSAGALDDLSLDLAPADQTTPSSTSSYEQFGTYHDGPEFTINDDIYGAHAQLPVNSWPMDEKFLGQFQQQLQQMPVCAAQPAQPQQAPHFSPIGESNAMLFTPNSLAEVDEGFEDLPTNCVGGDFQLFSSNDLHMKPQQFESLFTEEIPSNGLGFSQQPSQDMFGMDWAGTDYQGFAS